MPSVSFAIASGWSPDGGKALRAGTDCWKRSARVAIWKTSHFSRMNAPTRPLPGRGADGAG